MVRLHMETVMKVQFNSVQSLGRLGRPGGTWGTIQQTSSSSLFCRRPLWAVLAWAGMSTLWCCPSSIFSAYHGVAHLPRCPKGWFCRSCHGVWHAQTIQVSISWQLPGEASMEPQGSWSFSTPSCWSCLPNRGCREVPKALGFKSLHQ